jgi:hypothetical protein
VASSAPLQRWSRRGRTTACAWVRTPSLACSCAMVVSSIDPRIQRWEPAIRGRSTPHNVLTQRRLRSQPGSSEQSTDGASQRAALVSPRIHICAHSNQAPVQHSYPLPFPPHYAAHALRRIIVLHTQTPQVSPTQQVWHGPTYRQHASETTRASPKSQGEAAITTARILNILAWTATPQISPSLGFRATPLAFHSAARAPATTSSARHHPLFCIHHTRIPRAHAIRAAFLPVFTPLRYP